MSTPHAPDVEHRSRWPSTRKKLLAEDLKLKRGEEGEATEGRVEGRKGGGRRWASRGNPDTENQQEPAVLIYPRGREITPETKPAQTDKRTLKPHGAQRRAGGPQRFQAKVRGSVLSKR